MRFKVHKEGNACLVLKILPRTHGRGNSQAPGHCIKLRSKFISFYLKTEPSQQRSSFVQQVVNAETHSWPKCGELSDKQDTCLAPLPKAQGPQQQSQRSGELEQNSAFWTGPLSS